MHLKPSLNACGNHQANLSVAKAWIVLLLFSAILLSGCNQQRYKPAKWRAAERNKSTQQKNDADAVKQDWGSLPTRAGDVWGTLPNRNGSTLPGRNGSTLPGRGTLPFRGGWEGNSTLPNRGGIGGWGNTSTLPNRGMIGGGMNTLPQRQNDAWGNGSTLPQRGWQRDQMQRRPASTLPARRYQPINANRGAELTTSKKWSEFPSRSSLRGESKAANATRHSNSSDNPLR